MAYNPAMMQQPGPAPQHHTTVVMAQPQQQQPVMYQPVASGIEVAGNVNNNLAVAIQKRDWATGLFGCCDDCGTCISVLCCNPCMKWHIASRMGEFPMVAFCPGGIAALRMKLRTEMNIKGSLFADYSAVLCCGPCVECQMKREKDMLNKLVVKKQMLGL